MSKPEGPKPPPRVPLGPALVRTKADIERMAQVTDDDIEQARDLWHRKAPDGYEGLIDAEIPQPKGDGS